MPIEDEPFHGLRFYKDVGITRGEIHPVKKIFTICDYIHKFPVSIALFSRFPKETSLRKDMKCFKLRVTVTVTVTGYLF